MKPEDIAKEIVEDPMCSVCETEMEKAIVEALQKQREACAKSAMSIAGRQHGNFFLSEVKEACMGAEFSI